VSSYFLILQTLKRETGAIASLPFRVCSIRKYEDTEERTAEAPDRRKTTAKNQTELQIEAPTEGTTKRSEEWLRKTGEFIISAIGLRKSGLFPFVKRDRGLERRQVVWSKSGSICDPNEEGNVREPNEFLFGRTKTPMGFSKTPVEFPMGFHSTRSTPYIRTRGQLRTMIGRKNGSRRTRETMMNDMRLRTCYSAYEKSILVMFTTIIAA